MQRVFAIAGLLVALSAGAYVRWTPIERAADLRPRPDALEYEEAARNLVAGEGYALVFDGGYYPPRYPPGFSLLLVPSVWATGGEPGGGIWTVLAWAVAGIAAVFALGHLGAGPFGAVVAALLLAVAPLHVRWSRAVMADVPAATWVTVVIAAGVWCAARARGTRAWALVGVVAGLGALLRPACTVAALPVAFAAVGQGGGRRGVGRRVAAFGAGVGSGLLPLLAYQAMRFGSPFADGYAYWVVADLFSGRYVFGPPAGGGSEGNLVFYLAELVGAGTLVPLPLAALMVAGAVVGLRRPGPARWIVAITAAVGALLVGLFAPFFWQWDRLLLPFLPLAAVVAALPFSGDTSRLLRGGATVLLVFAMTAGWRDPRGFAPPDSPTYETTGMRILDALVEPDAGIVSFGEPLLMARLVRAGTERTWIPLAASEHQTTVQRWKRRPYAPASPATWIRGVGAPIEAPEPLLVEIDALLAANRPVYFAAVPGWPLETLREWGAALERRYYMEPVPEGRAIALHRVRVMVP